jgi:hypothetical protein
VRDVEKLLGNVGFIEEKEKEWDMDFGYVTIQEMTEMPLEIIFGNDENLFYDTLAKNRIKKMII